MALLYLQLSSEKYTTVSSVDLERRAQRGTDSSICVEIPTDFYLPLRPSQAYTAGTDGSFRAISQGKGGLPAGLEAKLSRRSLDRILLRTPQGTARA